MGALLHDADVQVQAQMKWQKVKLWNWFLFSTVWGLCKP